MRRKDWSHCSDKPKKSPRNPKNIPEKSKKKSSRNPKKSLKNPKDFTEKSKNELLEVVGEEKIGAAVTKVWSSNNRTLRAAHF